MDIGSETPITNNPRFEIRISKEKDDEDNSFGDAMNENLHGDTLTANYRMSLEGLGRSKSDTVRVETHIEINRFFSAGSPTSQSHSPKDFRITLKAKTEAFCVAKNEVKVKISKNKCGSVCSIF